MSRPRGRPLEPSRLALLSAGTVALLLAVNLLQVARPELFEVPVEGWPGGVAIVGGAALGIWLILRHPPVAMAALALIVVTGASRVLVRSFELPSLLQLMVPPLALLALAEGRGRGWRRLARPAPLLALAFLVWTLASSTWATATGPADAALAETARGVLILSLIALVAPRRRVLDAMLWTALIGSAAIAAIGVVQALTGADLGEVWGLARIKQAQIYGDVFEARVAGPYGDPNFFAQNLLLVLPIGAALAFTAADRTRRWIAALAVLALAGGIVFSYSRGAVLSLALMGFLSLPLLPIRERRRAAGTLLLVGLLAVVLPTDFTRRVTTVAELVPGATVEDPDSSFEKRRVVTRTAWLMFLDEPLLGVGAGNYPDRFGEYALELHSEARDYLDATDGARQYPHNLYLELAAERGLIGLTLFLGLVVTVLRGLRTSPAELERPAFALGAAMRIGLVGYLAAAIFLHGDFQRPFWMFLGLAIALVVRERGPERPEGDP